jgi:hypothetical protein
MNPNVRFALHVTLLSFTLAGCGDATLEHKQALDQAAATAGKADSPGVCGAYGQCGPCATDNGCKWCDGSCVALGTLGAACSLVPAECPANGPPTADGGASTPQVLCDFRDYTVDQFDQTDCYCPGTYGNRIGSCTLHQPAAALAACKAGLDAECASRLAGNPPSCQPGYHHGPGGPLCPHVANPGTGCSAGDPAPPPGCYCYDTCVRD